MNDMTPTSAERAEKLQGMGCKRKRVEDIRFVQGKGNYVDDIKLPGMLYGDFTRSPHAHARIKNIDTTKAAAVPGVVAVITAETLKTVNLAWMPTLAGDVQMVLADGKVLFQNQEVAFVIAEDRYVAADAADLVEVEYERCRATSIRSRRWPPDAPVIREDIKDKTDGAHGTRKHHNHIFNWQAGDKAATDAAFAKADVTIKEMIPYPRVHPCPLETCQCVASFDKIKGELTLVGHVPGAARHPHRRLADLENPRAQDPRHRARHRRRFRQQGRRLSGLHLRDRRLDRDRPAGEMGRGPHREPLHHGVRARLLHGDGDRRDEGRQGDRPALLHHRRPRRVRCLRQRHQMAGRPVQHHHRLVRLPGRACARSTASTPTRRRAASPIAARSASPRRPTASSAPWTSWRRSSTWIRPNSG